MIRRSISSLSLLVVVLMLAAACTVPVVAPAAPAAPADTSAGEGEAVADEVFIGMVQHSSIPFTQQMRDGFDAACADLGTRCEYAAPETINPETAIGMFDGMVTLGADAIILNAAPPDAWGRVVSEATGAGVLVNAINNYPPPDSGFGVFFWPAEVPSAKALAETFFDQLKASGVEGGQIVWGICAPGYVGQEQRADGWEQAFAEQTAFEGIGPLDTGHNVELDYAFWETTVLQYPDAVGFAGNCAFDGPNLARLKASTGGDWGIATFDLEPETLQGIQDGVVTVAIGSNPWLNAYLATKHAHDHLVSGAPVTQGQLDPGPELVTADNVTDFLARENDPELKHSFHLQLIEEQFSDLESLVGDFEAAPAE